MSHTPMTPVRVAALGLGYWGPNLARAWSGLEDAELAWLCDLDSGKLERFARQFPEARVTSDLDEVLADPAVEAVSVATSAPTHAALALRAIEAGKHVFVEKPLALTSSDARTMSAAADKAGLLMVVGHLLVHHPAVAKLKELVDAGELGRTHYLYTNRVNLGQVRSDENALWSLGAHDISVLLHLVGELPEAVSAQGQCFIHEGIEDVVFGVLRFPSGVIAHLHLSWMDPFKMRRVTIVGSDKMAVFDDMNADEKVKIFNKGVTHSGNGNGQPWQPASYGEYVQLRHGDTYIPRISSEEPLRIQCRHFVRCVRGLEVPRSDAAQGLAVVEVLEALQRSLDEGGSVVPFDASLLRA
ncbi:Gfo/Idh/MocA family oxidoreductase [Baekduia soli]|uniref:Gfo/Idh/MocA family oxidoreductase n=1 Tax=Baekduia soli TaxID=496014 RepID=A0A5B8UBQ6_9ACTN|nr:Gfo/Idh/MocA family oxidoreductase [Baekduia soli]QEC50082.1 Gfo/Idh/MocA family oxidoreductase [Baekduia soli]